MRSHGLRRVIAVPLDEATAIRLEELAAQAEINYTLLARCLLTLSLGKQPSLQAGRGRNQMEQQRASNFLKANWPKIASRFTPPKHLVNVKHSQYDITKKDC